MIKFFFWAVILGVLVLNGFQLLTIHQTNWKVQDVFDNISRKMPGSSEAAVRKKLPDLFKVGYISHDDVPEEFYTKLLIRFSDEKVEISSSYMETVWPLGRVENVDKEGTYDPLELTGMDYLRDKTRYDIYFEPYARTP
jgi:hypothetical protein